MSRRHLVIDLEPLPDPAVTLPTRHPTSDDADALAALMLDAYTGTIDADGSETLDDARTEVRGYFAGASGAPMLDASFVAVDDDAPVSAVLVARFDDVPLVAYAMTAADHKGRGLSLELMRHAIRALHRAGETRAHLWVTSGNPAERIYERLGFRDSPR
jgi:GNAT superfamily N-acetyltransferase